MSTNLLANLLAQDLGFVTIDAVPEDVLFAIVLDSRQPGICHDCLSVTEPHEPDARKNWCAECGANRVESFASVLGII